MYLYRLGGLERILTSLNTIAARLTHCAARNAQARLHAPLILEPAASARTNRTRASARRAPKPRTHRSEVRHRAQRDASRRARRREPRHFLVGVL